MMQQPMMQQPVGIMASSPELMQASMGYNQGGPVQGYAGGKTVTPGNRAGVIIGETYSDPFLNPPATVDITQEPIEFQETVTTPGNRAGVIIGETTDSAAAAPDNSDADKLAKAEELGTKVVDKNSTEGDKNLTPPEEAGTILAAMGANVPKGTKGKIGAMKDLIKETFGVDASRYDNLKSLNRAMVGFAIAEGGDIASALKQGAAGAAAIEEKSLARDDSMSQMALQQVFAEKLAGMRASRSGAPGGANRPRSPINAYQDARESAMRLAQDPVFAVRINKSGKTIEQWVHEQALGVVERSYTPEQLVGTRFAQPVEETDAVDITTPTVTGVGEITDEVPTTPGDRFEDQKTGKIMVVGEDGVAREE